jgi:hypothetical protein
MSRVREKATIRKDTNTNTRGRGSSVKEVQSPQKGRKGNRHPRHEEDDVRAEALADGHAARASGRAEELAEGRRDAEAEMEAVDHDAEKTPPPEISARVVGPAAATADHAEANDKAAEAKKRTEKLTAELELAKAQLQKERKKRQMENKEEVSISKPRRSSTSVISSRKKAVSTVNYVFTFEFLTIILCVQKIEGTDKLVALLADQVVLCFIHGKVVIQLVTLLGLC